MDGWGPGLVAYLRLGGLPREEARLGREVELEGARDGRLERGHLEAHRRVAQKAGGLLSNFMSPTKSRESANE